MKITFRLCIVLLYVSFVIVGCSHNRDRLYLEHFNALNVLMLQTKTYENVTVNDVFYDLFKRMNFVLSEHGYLGVGMTIRTTDGNAVCEMKVDVISIPALPVIGAYEFVASKVGLSVSFDNGHVVIEDDKSSVKTFGQTSSNVDCSGAGRFLFDENCAQTNRFVRTDGHEQDAFLETLNTVKIAPVLFDDCSVFDMIYELRRIGNERLKESGCPFGLSIVVASDKVNEHRSIDIPESSIFDALTRVAALIDCELEYESFIRIRPRGDVPERKVE